MTDREMLELAAKAAGIQLVWHNFNNIPTLFKGLSSDEAWNPLTDDGDALRLAVKLGLAVSIDSVEQETWAHHEQAFKGSSEKWKCCPTSNNGDEDGYAATRRAIVRAAAEIGRQMP